MRNLFLHFIDFDKLELYDFRCRCKRRESGSSVLEIERLGIVVILIIHSPQIGVGIQHGFLSFDPVILYQFTGNANPGTLMESRDFHLGVSHDLLRTGFDLAGLDVQLTIENVGGAKRTDTGLITFHRCQIAYTGILQLQLERRKFTKEEIVEWISKYKYGNINDLDY